MKLGYTGTQNIKLVKHQNESLLIQSNENHHTNHPTRSVVTAPGLIRRHASLSEWASEIKREREEEATRVGIALHGTAEDGFMQHQHSHTRTTHSHETRWKGSESSKRVPRVVVHFTALHSPLGSWSGSPPSSDFKAAEPSSNCRAAREREESTRLFLLLLWSCELTPHLLFFCCSQSVSQSAVLDTYTHIHTPTWPPHSFSLHFNVIVVVVVDSVPVPVRILFQFCVIYEWAAKTQQQLCVSWYPECELLQ